MWRARIIPSAQFDGIIDGINEIKIYFIIKLQILNITIQVLFWHHF
ncbi:hypothetical protein CEV32_1329 [Brucella rhizosphaerae]|uniref:Uncharacterized protein n=1 Tax=Brucella rhizosphaerae TaxID=571254 RepID=A0A256FAS1_9HYPH|nr:hypothetical protein CEV32_1329 [Brucella rhizosphaerae]